VLFEKEAAAFLEAKPAARSVDGFRWMCIAGVEAANEDTAPTLVKLLAAVEEMRRTAEADLKARIDRGDLIKKLTNTDPAGSLRDIILRGLCGNPNPKTKEILTPYQDEVKGDWSYLAGLALLRAGNPQGMQCLLNRWSYSPDDKVGEAFLIYSGVDLLSNTMRGADGGLAKAKTWYAQSKDGQPLRDRIARVNQEGLSQSLVEQLMLWP
jgi:hypothetical protein